MYALTSRDLESILQFHHYTPSEMETIRTLLLDHERYHSYPITLDEARSAGLHVHEMDDQLVLTAFYELYNLWSTVEDDDVEDSE